MLIWVQSSLQESQKNQITVGPCQTSEAAFSLYASTSLYETTLAWEEYDVSH